MKKYYVSYLDQDGDVSTVWNISESEQETIENIKDEYWDVQLIIDCFPV